MPPAAPPPRFGPRPARRGHSILEAALALAVLAPCFTGFVQVTLALQTSLQLEAAVQAAGLYAAAADYHSPDEAPPPQFVTQVRNLVLRASCPGLHPEQIDVRMAFHRGAPHTVTVAVVGYQLQTIFGAWRFDGKPAVSLRYRGHWQPF